MTDGTDQIAVTDAAKLLRHFRGLSLIQHLYLSAVGLPGVLMLASLVRSDLQPGGDIAFFVLYPFVFLLMIALPVAFGLMAVKPGNKARRMLGLILNSLFWILLLWLGHFNLVSTFVLVLLWTELGLSLALLSLELLKLLRHGID